MEKRSLIKKLDLLIIIGLIAVSGIFFVVYNSLFNYKSVKAEIIADGKTVKTVSLDKDMVFRLDERPEIEIEIKDGKIRFLHSDCPDKICVNTGFISKGGQTAVCLPNKVSIRIIKDKSDDSLDSVAG